MSKSLTERKLRDAVKHATPDMRDKVIASCKEAGGGAPVIIKSRRNRQMERFYSLVAIAAIMLLACNMVLNMARTGRVNRVETIVDIDVNPSIELSINADDRIVSVRAINEDAIAILDGMELEGTQTKVAVNAIVGSMFEHGYLLGETDSILVSVENSNVSKAQEVQERITGDIDCLMRACSRDVDVIGQAILQDDELVNVSQQYGISEGKAALIRKILEATDAYTEEDLVYLNITELNDIILGIENFNMESSEATDESVVSDNEAEVQDSIESSVSDSAAQVEIPELPDAVSENSVSSNVSDNIADNSSADGHQVSANSVSNNEASVSDNEASISDNAVAEVTSEDSTLE